MKIKIISPPGNSAHGTRIFVDDTELQEVCDITVSFPVDGRVTVKTSMLASEPMTLEGDFDLHVQVIAHPDFALVEEWTSPMRRVYRCVPVKR